MPLLRLARGATRPTLRGTLVGPDGRVRTGVASVTARLGPAGSSTTTFSKAATASSSAWEVALTAAESLALAAGDYAVEWGVAYTDGSTERVPSDVVVQVFTART